jgi:hypothetical protein
MSLRFGSVCSGIEAAKTCAVCRVEKPLDQFHKQGERGHHAYCKDCYNARYRGNRRRKEDAASKRAQNFRRRYGLSAEEVAAMLASQGGVCAICGHPPTRPVVDHCHKTGRVRAILCHPCNIKLPAIEDAAFVAAAEAYLRKFQ